MDQSEQIPAACWQPLFLNQAMTVTYQKQPSQQLISDPVTAEDGVTNGTCEEESALCPFDTGDVFAGNNHLTVKNEDLSEFSNSDLSLPEVCVSTNSNSCEEDEMNHEVQQAYKIFTGFLLDKHKGITRPFLHPIGHQEAQRCIEAVQDRGPAQLKQSMCLQRMEEKFVSQEYETITEFVADFRLMLENCYRYHGVDHWISKQAQKLEIMLEQKLTLLSRTLREKTTLAVTSRGRFCAEEERGQGGTSTRRRLAPRSLATITVGGHESIMVHTLRLEEQQRAKEEKRQRELEKKEAVETSAKEVDKWEHTLLSQASPHTVDALWEIPAIGHFLCLAQTALNLPEIVFFELERCLLMPRCSLLLSKIMSSLLSTSQRRASVNRRPPLPYRHWESELRQRVMGWYRCVGASHDQPGRAEQLGLCQQFFSTLGEVSPLEEKPFHLLPFYQRVWLLKGLCDHVYETQKSVQDAVLAQPIHECRESILGYDSKENAYIHFPHFCGADLRIYRQSPSSPPAFPFPSLLVKKVAIEPGTKGVTYEAERKKSDGECYGDSVNTREFEFHDFGRSKSETLGVFHKENSNNDEDKRLKLSSIKKEEGSGSGSSEGESLEDSKMDHNKNSNISTPFNTNHTERCGTKTMTKEEEVKLQLQPVTVKKERKCSLSVIGNSKGETREPCLSVGEHSYTGRSPARSVNPTASTDAVELNIKEESPSLGRRKDSCVECFKNKINQVSNCSCDTSRHTTQLFYERTHKLGEKSTGDIIWTKKKKRKKKREHEQLSKIRGKHKRLQHTDQTGLSSADAAQSAPRRVSPTVSRKDKKKRHRTGKKLDATKKISDESPVEPSFKLVCSNLDELRDLISKTEDELDDLESTKKRLGRWYYRKEAVKELHSTLIRLLNELLPWEPRLVKAHQRNRLRLKKEFDDFKKHPEYNNFVREERFTSSSSSSSSDEDEEKGLGRNLLSVVDHYRKSEEEDLEHLVPRGLWSGAKTREIGAEAADETASTYLSPTHLRKLQVNVENGIDPLSRPQAVSRGTAFVANSGPQARTEGISPNQSTDSSFSWAAAMPLQSPLSSKSTILHPTTGLPKGYTPIPVLLAKSVGNKVTLMKRPADCAGFNSVDAQGRGTLVSPPTSVMDKAKISKTQLWPSSSQKDSEQIKAQRQQQAHLQLEVAPVTKALGTEQQTKPNQAVPKSPVQVVRRSPQVPGHQEGKDGNSSSTVGPSVNPGQTVMRQVVILTSLHQQQSKDIQVPVSQVVSPVCMSTDVPGFTIPENRIPVQPVAPLKNNMTVSNHSPSVSPCQQQGSLKTSGFKTIPICSPQTSTPPGVTPNLGSPSSAAPPQPIKNTDPKQELKTVCIRDSQSILVTTRGGNTGIVKVQTSSDGAIGSMSTSPVITISPQFKAFLVSKTSSFTSSCTIPAVNTSVSAAQPQRPVPPVLKSVPLSTSPLQSPFHGTTTGSIPITGAESQTKGSFVALNQASNISACSTVPKMSGHLAPVTAASLVKSAVAVPSQSSTAVPQLLTQLEVTKTGLKRVGTDERAQVTKFILLTPSSSPTSSEAVSKITSPSKKTLSNSKVMLIGQPTVTSSITSIGSIPTQTLGMGASEQLLTTPFPNPTVKMGISPEQLMSCGSTEALTKVKNISLPSGFQIQLAGKTTAIGQTIGALSSSPSKRTPVSVPQPGRLPATVPGLLLVSNSKTNTTWSTPLASSLCTPSFAVVSQMASNMSTSVATTLSTGTKKSPSDMNPVESFSSCPAQLPITVQSSPAQRSTSLIHQQSNVQNDVVEDRFSLPNPLAPNTSLSSGTCAPSITSAAGTIQQRLVINTSAPLAAGTQIILNNTRFVVPSQGLGPGSHVLIISGPAPPQVPPASAAGTSASAPPQVANHAIVAPQVLSQPPLRPSGVPAATSPFVACTPAVRPPLLATTNNILPSHPTGMPGQSSTSVSSKTIVSELPNISTARAGDLASTVVGTSGLSTVPALFSPMVTSAPASCNSQSPIRLAAGSAMQADAPSAILPAGTHLLSTPPLSATVPLSSPVKPVPALIASAAAPLAAGTPLHSSVTQHTVSVTAPDQGLKPPQSGVRMAAPSAAPSQTVLQAGQGHRVRKHAPVVMQMLLSGTPPTVAAPPIVNLVSRIQTLPVATVPPIGTTTRTFETVPVGTTPSSSSDLVRTPAQPISSNNSTHPAVVSTDQTFDRTSTSGIQTSVASKLLISPDGAVLSTAQRQVSPAEVTNCSKPTGVLVVSSSSSSGTLNTHDSSLQHSWAK